MEGNREPICFDVICDRSRCFCHRRPRRHHIRGLHLEDGAQLVIRDYDGDFRIGLEKPPIAVTIDQHLSMSPGGALRMVFEADAWDSTISFIPGIPVALGGTLELTFADGVNAASQVGRTFKLFDWTGVTPTGAFEVESSYIWDLSNLYATGEVTLTAVPEPATFVLTALGLFGLVIRFRRPSRRIHPNYKREESHAEAQRHGGNSIRRSSLRPLRLGASLFLIAVFAWPAQADIFQWEYINLADPSQGKRQSATLAPSGAGFDAFPGVNLTAADLTMAYLIGADLTNASAIYTNLTNADLSHANLTNTSFVNAMLTHADFTGANVRGANFSKDLNSGTGITHTQLSSTASYQAHELNGIDLSFNDLTGGDFVGQNLTNAYFSNAELTDANFREANLTDAHFYSATLTDANFTAADARGAEGLDVSASGITTNLILPNGYIDGLDLDADGFLVVRDYDGNVRYEPAGRTIPITVDQHMTTGPGGALRFEFEADAWDSTISFAPGIPVTLGGTLELTFAADVNPAAQLSRTLKIFDWTGVAPTGTFAISSPYAWDLSNLYATGEVTLTAIPEPTSLVLLLLSLLLIRPSRRARCTLAALVLVACTSPAFGDLPMTGTYVREFQAVDTLLQNFMAGKPIPGGTITITLNDKVIYERGIGYSNSVATAPMQETALMRLASLSKPVTASAIHQLAKDGHLNLNDKVFNIDGNGGLLDVAPYNGVLGDHRLRDITVQHLLEHRGGWNRDTAGDLAFRDIQIASALGVPSPPGILNTAKYILSRPLQFTPGADFNYSNVGYMFLGMVVETVSGQPYETYVDENVLGPAGIPAWEIDAGRTFVADQNPREPVYSAPSNTTQNVYDPTGPRVPWPYGGWDHERFIALGGLIASSKAMATLAQDRIIGGPEIGILRSDYTTQPEYWWYHGGSLEGTDTLVMGGMGVWGADWKDATYSILFDRRPTTATSYSNDLALLLEPILEGIAAWPGPLAYAGDFTDDQWLTLDDVTLFNQALMLGDEAAFTMAFPTARYGAGDFDGNGQVNLFDSAQFVAALQHAGAPAGYIDLVPTLPGDFNLDGAVDGADFLAWQRGESPDPLSAGDLAEWKTHFGEPNGFATKSSVPEPANVALLATAILAQLLCPTRRQAHFKGA